ncbi:STAS domain-containing protein [Streptomyces sp. NPDC059627]
MSHLVIHTRTAAAGPVVELTGELDYDSCTQVLDLLPELSLRAGQQLVIDLTGITSCDSSGITALIAARNLALAAQAGIALATVPRHVSRIFSVVGLDQVFATHPTAQAAEAAWTRRMTGPNPVSFVGDPKKRTTKGAPVPTGDPGPQAEESTEGTVRPSPSPSPPPTRE